MVGCYVYNKFLKKFVIFALFILTKKVLSYIINKHFKISADMAQLVEHILGKDEVTGSIPVISSKKPLLTPRVFLLL